MKKITIAIFGTRKYLYATRVLSRRILSNIQGLSNRHEEYEFAVIVVSDKSAEARAAYEGINKTLSSRAECHLLALDIDDGKKFEPYKPDSQLLIAQMDTAAFEFGREANSDYFWCVEGDVLPPENALRCMLNTLDFDDGYYDVAMVTYPSQGGGGFLGGRGTPEKHICDNWDVSERIIPKKLEARLRAFDKREKQLMGKNQKPDTAFIEEYHKLNREIEVCPPKGNVFELNAKGWRRRGWLEFAYPAIGKGAIVPTDWVGLGCTLLSRRALSLAHFEGYTGMGTQDLFLCWNKWHPEGLKFAVITHTACEHVIRATDEEGGQDFNNLILCRPYYETKGELVGHLRMVREPYYSFEAGEQSKPEPIPKKKSTRKMAVKKAAKKKAAARRRQPLKASD